MIRVLIGIALFALMFLGYKYTGSKIILFGFVMAYLPVLFALVVSSFRNTIVFVERCVKFCIWLALGTFFLYLCDVGGWNPYIILALGASFLLFTAVIMISEGADIQAEKEKANQVDIIGKIMDTIKGQILNAEVKQEEQEQDEDEDNDNTTPAAADDD